MGATLAGGIYLLALATGITGLRLMAKPIPVLCLLAWTRGGPEGAYRRRLGAGLALSAAGDILIDLSFVAGLASFLLAHVAYTAAFLADTTRPCLLRALPCAIFGAGVTALLWPDLGDMRPAVVAYVLAIGTMAWRAAARVGHRGVAHPGEWAALAGATLFALSDTLIAFDRFFRSPGGAIPGAGVAIILLYWAGQAGIATSARAR